MICFPMLIRHHVFLLLLGWMALWRVASLLGHGKRPFLRGGGAPGPLGISKARPASAPGTEESKNAIISLYRSR